MQAELRVSVFYFLFSSSQPFDRLEGFGDMRYDSAKISIPSPFHASSTDLCGPDLYNFSDDIQLFSSAPPANFGPLSNRQSSLSSMSSCGWIPTNPNLTVTKLKESLLVLTREQVSPAIGILRFGGRLIPFQPMVKSLEVVSDSYLIMYENTSSDCPFSYLELHSISAIHPFLTKNMTSYCLLSTSVLK